MEIVRSLGGDEYTAVVIGKIYASAIHPSYCSIDLL